MSASVINKVDMSLDEIIKINKVEKKQKAQLQAARGAKSARSRGGQGRGTGRARGRGGAVVVRATRGGGMSQGRGSFRGRGGRGGKQQLTPGSMRGKTQQLVRTMGNNFHGRGRGQSQRARGSAVGSQSSRGRGGPQVGIQLFSRSGLNKQTAAQQQNQRLNKARKQAALLREKQLALKNLQQAQKNMHTVTLALQKSNRDATFNQRRGLGSAELTATTNGRGRRKLLANLIRKGVQGSNLNNNNNIISGSSRQLNYTSVTISNPAALYPTQSPRGRRRPWNKPRVAPAAQPFKIEVTNQSPLPPPVQQFHQQQLQHSSVMEKLKSLKPAVPTTYKFQKNVFSAPTTGISLSERFSGTSSSLEERKVFV